MVSITVIAYAVILTQRRSGRNVPRIWVTRPGAYQESPYNRLLLDLRFSPDSEVVLLKLGEARIGKENLEELPDILRRLLRRPDSGRTVREADANGLVDEEPTIVPVSAHHPCAQRQSLTYWRPRSTSSD